MNFSDDDRREWELPDGIPWVLNGIGKNQKNRINTICIFESKIVFNRFYSEMWNSPIQTKHVYTYIHVLTGSEVLN